MLPELFVLVVVIAFVCEFFDSSLGMGYGTTLTPILLLLGFHPLTIIPSILLTEAVTGITAGFFHHRFENVDFGFRSPDFKVALTLTGFGAVGVIIAALVAVKLPENILKIYIGALVLVIGIAILINHNKTHSFSWKKIMGLGTLAAFNKGMSGGGYGPVVTGGQILSGVDGKKAIGIASFAEGLVCIFGVTAYLFINHIVYFNWNLITSLLIGSLSSVPLAAYVVKRFHPKRLKLIIGIVSIVLGTMILTKIFI